MTKTKHDLIEFVYDTLQIYSKRDVIAIVETFFELIKNSLEEGEEVTLSGFGKFRVIEKAQRMGRNPKTGDKAVIPARRVVAFKPSMILRQKVNRG